MVLIMSSLRDTMKKLVEAARRNHSHFLAELRRAIFLVSLP